MPMVASTWPSSEKLTGTQVRNVPGAAHGCRSVSLLHDLILMNVCEGGSAVLPTAERLGKGARCAPRSVAQGGPCWLIP
jgi:hypothetical protein